MPTLCPACGSTDIETSWQDGILPVPYGPPAIYKERVDRCKSCGEAGDFENENDKAILTSLKNSERTSVNQMLQSLSRSGIRSSYLERSLGLPARTVARWKSGEFSAVVLALLRTVATYPWILEVADSRFDRSIAATKVVEEASRLLTSMIMLLSRNGVPAASTSAGNVETYVRIYTHLPAQEAGMQSAPNRMLQLPMRSEA